MRDGAYINLSKCKFYQKNIYIKGENVASVPSYINCICHFVFKRLLQTIVTFAEIAFYEKKFS